MIRFFRRQINRFVYRRIISRLVELAEKHEKLANRARGEPKRFHQGAAYALSSYVVELEHARVYGDAP